MYLESFLICMKIYLEHASIVLFILQSLMAPLNFSADIIADKLNQLHLSKLQIWQIWQIMSTLHSSRARDQLAEIP